MQTVAQWWAMVVCHWVRHIAFLLLDYIQGVTGDVNLTLPPDGAASCKKHTKILSGPPLFCEKPSTLPFWLNLRSGLKFTVYVYTHTYIHTPWIFFKPGYISSWLYSAPKNDTLSLFNFNFLGDLSLYLNHLIAWCMRISKSQFGTLSIGIYLSILAFRKVFLMKEW